jgi:hypothetical protein
MGWMRKRTGPRLRREFYHSSRAFSRQSGVLLALFFVVTIQPASASDVPEPIPVVRGQPSAFDTEVVALCPDISETPEVFLARDGDGLAGHLARGHQQVYLVDPWSSPTAHAEGFDGVVREVYPKLLERLAQQSGRERITWIGHGLCGLLPLAAAARPSGNPPPTRWVALGTRFEWSLPSPALKEWIQAALDARPLPDVVQKLFFTGFREGLGARISSLPSGIERRGSLAESFELFHRTTIGRPPPKAVLEDLQRWIAAGKITDRAGWIDYGIGYDNVRGPALVIAGASDSVAPPEDVLPALDRFGDEAGVLYRLLSRVEGDREEYGHLGMLLSKHAGRDVDELISAWLRGAEKIP